LDRKVFRVVLLTRPFLCALWVTPSPPIWTFTCSGFIQPADVAFWSPCDAHPPPIGRPPLKNCAQIMKPVLPSPIGCCRQLLPCCGLLPTPPLIGLRAPFAPNFLYDRSYFLMFNFWNPSFSFSSFFAWPSSAPEAYVVWIVVLLS